jgi:hypothetical protein
LDLYDHKDDSFRLLAFKTLSEAFKAGVSLEEIMREIYDLIDPAHDSHRESSWQAGEVAGSLPVNLCQR